MTSDQYIESILFFRGSPATISFLAKVLGKSKEEIEKALTSLSRRLEDSGLVLVRFEDEVSLGTNPKASGFIEAIIKEELSREISKAGLEILSIIIYKHPISRGEIDHIRGVNSSFILRNLLMKGLIEKTKGQNDQRLSLYKPTIELISFLGLQKIEQMPEYIEIRKKLDELQTEIEENNEEGTTGDNQ